MLTADRSACSQSSVKVCLLGADFHRRNLRQVHDDCQQAVINCTELSVQGDAVLCYLSADQLSVYDPLLEKIATDEAIQLTEIYEYACSLRHKNYYLPHLVPFKFVLAIRLLDAGLVERCFRYLKVVALALTRDMKLFPPTLIRQVVGLVERLQFHPDCAAIDEFSEGVGGKEAFHQQPDWIRALIDAHHRFLQSAGSAMPLADYADETYEQESVDREESMIQTNQMPTSEISGNPISSNQIPAYRIPANQILTNQIPANQMTTNQVPANQKSVNQIPANKISANEIPGNQNSAYQVSANQMVDSQRRHEEHSVSNRLPKSATFSHSLERDVLDSPDWSRSSSLADQSLLGRSADTSRPAFGGMSSSLLEPLDSIREELPVEMPIPAPPPLQPMTAGLMVPADLPRRLAEPPAGVFKPFRPAPPPDKSPVDADQADFHNVSVNFGGFDYFAMTPDYTEPAESSEVSANLLDRTESGQDSFIQSAHSPQAAPQLSSSQSPPNHGSSLSPQTHQSMDQSADSASNDPTETSDPNDKNSAGWLQRFFNRKKSREIILPDDSAPQLVYDAVNKRWVQAGLDGGNASSAGSAPPPPPPPPQMIGRQIGGGGGEPPRPLGTGSQRYVNIGALAGGRLVANDGPRPNKPMFVPSNVN